MCPSGWGHSDASAEPIGEPDTLAVNNSGRSDGTVGDRTTARDGTPVRPTSTDDLRPRSLLTVAEVVMLPFFWLAPLSLLVLGGAIALDLSESRDRLEEYALESPFDTITYGWCLVPFTIAQLATLGYRMVRISKIRAALGFSHSGFERHVAQLNPETGRLVGVAFGLQLLGVAVLFFDPIGAGLLAVGLLLAPFAAWYDLRAVRAIDAVDWGWPRYLHILFGWLPGATFVYLLKRRQQVQLAALIDIWTADPASIEPAVDEKTSLERFSDWIDQRT